MVSSKALQGTGLERVVHQPSQVKAFARFRSLRAKTDRLDARLIAQATAQVDTVKAAPDPRLAERADRLTAYEQASDLVAQLKTQLEHFSLPDLIDLLKAQLRQAAEHKKRLATDLLRRVKVHADLARRLDLARSLPGVGDISALVLVIRMPELGALKRGQAAPFARDSGLHKGQRHIAGGRRRPRRLLYMAAFSAKRCCPQWQAFAEQLKAKGKAHEQIVTAVERKLIEAANLVFQRDHPWEPSPL